jgi:hypothetical protein
LDVHLKGRALPFAPKSYIIYGNEDAPERVDLYATAEPLVTDAPHTVIFGEQS